MVKGSLKTSCTLWSECFMSSLRPLSYTISRENPNIVRVIVVSTNFQDVIFIDELKRMVPQNVYINWGLRKRTIQIITAHSRKTLFTKSSRWYRLTLYFSRWNNFVYELVNRVMVNFYWLLGKRVSKLYDTIQSWYKIPNEDRKDKSRWPYNLRVWC